jgi:hypothetical protein
MTTRYVVVDDCEWGDMVIVAARDWPRLREGLLDSWEESGSLGCDRDDVNDPAVALEEYVKAHPNSREHLLGAAQNRAMARAVARLYRAIA